MLLRSSDSLRLSASICLMLTLPWLQLYVLAIKQSIRENDSRSQQKVHNPAQLTELFAASASTPPRHKCGGNGMHDPFDEVCKCFDCWEGPQCQKPKPLCFATTGSGAATSFCEDYWLVTKLNLLVPFSFHNTYYFGPTFTSVPPEPPILPRLENAIRRMHAAIGNAYVTNQHIIGGVGSLELIHAALHVFGTASTRPVEVLSEAPNWSPVVVQTLNDQPHTDLFTWRTASNHSVVAGIELVTSPNNPDYELRKKRTLAKFTVYDHCYLWPQFHGVSPVAYGIDAVATFSISKFTGLSSTRLGWALIANKAVADGVYQYGLLNRVSVPIDAQVKGMVALEHILSTDGAIIKHGRALMLHRWEALDTIFNGSQLWHIASIRTPSGDSYFEVADHTPTPSYLWCELLDGRDAAALMLRHGIQGDGGVKYGAHRRFVRLIVMQRQRDFEVLLANIEYMMSRLG